MIILIPISQIGICFNKNGGVHEKAETFEEMLKTAIKTIKKKPEILKKLLLLLYPNRCMLCDRVLVYGQKASMCGHCVEMVPSYAVESRKIVISAVSDLDGVYSAFRYSGHMREAVLRFKNRGMKEYALSMGALMKNAEWPEDFSEVIRDAGFFVPVPLHRSRRKERGYNQAEALAQALSGQYGKPMSTALTRKKKTVHMYNLPKSDRSQNVHGAFTISDSSIFRGKNVILVDDIYTTGATAEECARILKAAGAGRVYLLTFTVAGSHLLFQTSSES